MACAIIEDSESATYKRQHLANSSLLFLQKVNPVKMKVVEISQNFRMDNIHRMKKSKVKNILHIWPGSPALRHPRPCLGQLRALLRRVQRRGCWTSGLSCFSSIWRSAPSGDELNLTLVSTSHISSTGQVDLPRVDR